MAMVAPLAAQMPAASTPDRNSPEMAWWRASMETRDERLQWWRHARFGMFIHWGVYSRLGGIWKGEPVGGYAEHIMRRAKIPLAVYRQEVAGQFNPVEFDADRWVRTLKNAGMRYLIITSKHHDGFAMFDSDCTDYNIVKATPFRRDPMRELKEACARQGIRFGFYYSHAWDWQDPNAPGNDWDCDNPGGDRKLHGGAEWWTASPEWLLRVRKYVDGKAIPQVRELIRKYDPDIMWFDTASKNAPSENIRVLQAARAAKPALVVNSRVCQGGNFGDYQSTTDRPAEFPPHEGDWEGIPTTNESYGYSASDQCHKPPSHFIRLLAKAAARGGNLLMNIGPMGNGRFDPKDEAILAGIGEWMKANEASIRGTSRTPLPVQAWGESTRRGSTLYLHVFDWPAAGPLVVGGLRSDVRRAYLLGDAKQTPLRVKRLSPEDVSVEVPRAAPDPVDTVVVLETTSGEIQIDRAQTHRLLSPTQVNTLRAFDGERHGGVKWGAGKAENAYVENWTRAKDAVTWAARVAEPAQFEVEAVYDAVLASAGSRYGVRFGSRELAGTVREGKNQVEALGRVRLEPGACVIRVASREIRGGELLRLRSLVLRPVEK
jgi:alpha-L-fucosidase